MCVCVYVFARVRYGGARAVCGLVFCTRVCTSVCAGSCKAPVVCGWLWVQEYVYVYACACVSMCRGMRVRVTWGGWMGFSVTPVPMTRRPAPSEKSTTRCVTLRHASRLSLFGLSEKSFTGHPVWSVFLISKAAVLLVSKMTHTLISKKLP